ncbi:MAG: T9SS type A sorting domain-containing protein, partial [Bacteroidia bacterium]
LGIKQSALNTLAVYPNPTSGILHLPLGAYSSYTITNALGQLMEQNTLSGTTIDLSNLKSDVYILTVQSEHKTHTSRIIKR